MEYISSTQWRGILLSCTKMQRKAKKPKLGGAGIKMPDLALERDIMLDSFHAIGKFLYNKREIRSSQV